MQSKKIIVALDSNNFSEIEKLVKSLKKDVYAFKIGYQFFFNFGLIGYKKIFSICPKIFLDLKLHDIPNTVCRGIIPLIDRINPYMMTLHATGGEKMLQEVVKVVKEKSIKDKPLLLGVTVLTSLDLKSLVQLGWEANVKRNVINYALLCKKAGLNGVVCSAHEIEDVRKACGRSFLIVTPGIRSKEKSKDDQARVLTAKEAFSKGTDYIVIGRPVINSRRPKQEILNIIQSN